jgi:hypothetical protein
MTQSLAPMGVVNIADPVNRALERLRARIIGLSGRTLFVHIEPQEERPQFQEVAAALKGDPELWETFDDISLI